jgi:hypothetical protein
MSNLLLAAVRRAHTGGDRRETPAQAEPEISGAAR